MRTPLPLTSAPQRLAHAAPPPVRVVVVDDSLTARAVLSRLVAGEADMAVVGSAASAEEAIALLGTVGADVILLDLEMPGMGGMKALPALIAAGRGARVLVVSTLAAEGAEATVAALALGAADTIRKPEAGRFDTAYRQQLTDRIRAVGCSAQPIGLAPALRPRPPLLRRGPERPLRALALGASTGGIHALGQFFAALPRRIAAPILVTQHLPPAFMPVFARQLEHASGRSAEVAADGTLLRDDVILVAPGHAHMTVRERAGQVRVVLDTTPLETNCLPAVDPMFASLADVFGAGVTAVVLTGMGRDGLAGARRIVAAGGGVLAQDEESSAVWGMPRAVVLGGCASAVLPPDALAGRIAAEVGAQAWI
ncbi:chemotaxis-specific protein-glutamate methyltransferase CheB [Parablastomonas sp. CN1-191]|uniref:chemotaxis-specific protein-glutamate methyltransferase CheB n=1 Tax=Parablastomonas sp. CN1-191 TaxID=3400908 RepID=UPI003BF83C64